MRAVPSVSSLGERVRGLFQREPKAVTPKTILIVEGNAKHRQATARLVQSLGYQPVQSAGLSQAMGLLAEQDPEFVLLGFDLDDSNGLGCADANPRTGRQPGDHHAGAECVGQPGGGSHA